MPHATRRLQHSSHEPPVLPPPELRRSPREVKVVPRLEPEWSEYSMDRSGGRHARTRDESYDQLQAARYQQDTDVKAAALENADLAANLNRVFRAAQGARPAWCVRRS